MQGLLILHAVGTELRVVTTRFRWGPYSVVDYFPPGAQAGHGNTGRQDNIQTGFTVVGKGDSDLCPPGIFLTLRVRMTFLGNIRVINRLSHNVLV